MILALALFASARVVIGALTPDYFWKYRTEKENADRYFGEWVKASAHASRMTRELAEARKAFDELSQQVSEGAPVDDAEECRQVLREVRAKAFGPWSETLVARIDAALSGPGAQPSGDGQGSEIRAGVPDAAPVQANRSDVQRGSAEPAETIPETDGHARGGNGGH